MKKSALLVAAWLLAGSVEAAGTFKFSRKVVLDKLVSELAAAGYNIRPDDGYVQCTQNKDTPWDCVITWGRGGETRDPSPVINTHQYVESAAARKALQAQMRSLAEKWKAGTITAAEKDDLLKIFVFSYLGL
ncbi:MAG: hypothetical protein HYZ75_08180 [Elusimicrobia bacterium]|nr:hypothetical protein [Elusimicrobiota bacterium]